MLRGSPVAPVEYDVAAFENVAVGVGEQVGQVCGPPGAKGVGEVECTGLERQLPLVALPQDAVEVPPVNAQELARGEAHDRGGSDVVVL